MKCIVCKDNTDEIDEICSLTCWQKLSDVKKGLILTRRAMRISFDSALAEADAPLSGPGKKAE